MKRAIYIYLVLMLLVLGCGEDSMHMDSGDDYRQSPGSTSDYDYDENFNMDASDNTGGAPTSPADTGFVFEPEVKERFDYRIPVSSGKFVFIPDKINNKVVAVNSLNYSISLVDVGRNPTHLVPVNDEGAVAVLCLDTGEVYIIRMGDRGVEEVTIFEVRPDTNALKVSKDGRFVLAFWDSLFEEETGAPRTTQEISVIDTLIDNEEVYHMSIGMNPMDIIFDDDSTRAFVITEGGINTVELDNLSHDMLPASISLFDYTKILPSKTEVIIDPSGSIAFGRREDESSITVAWLQGSNQVKDFNLDSIPTDLQIAPSGDFGILVFRYIGKVAFFNLPLSESNETPFIYMDLESESTGSATITPDGNTIALFTTAPNPTLENSGRILTVLIRQGQGWIKRTKLLGRNIQSILAAPDSKSLIVNHQQLGSAHPVNERHSYSLVKVPDLQDKIQLLEVEATIPVLFSPDGDFAYYLLDTRNVNIINLRTFIVDQLTIGSVPTAIGFATNTEKVFISQDHPSGRMSFLDANGGNIKTVTGYTLNN